MYQYELEITINKKSFFRIITADNHREALEFGSLIYPEADFVELA
jgi:hypothetical protein